MLYNSNMKNLREIIPHNISALRKQHGLTQIDLAKKVNYSDKAVSRWEKGEVLPDIETLQSIGRVFNVPTSYLLEEHEETPKTEAQVHARNEISFRILTILAVWTIATIVFVLGELYFNVIKWEIFVWAVPASCLVSMYLNRKTKNRLLSCIARSILNWSLLASIYIEFIELNAWLIFLIGIPIQAAIIIAYITKRKPKEL